MNIGVIILLIVVAAAALMISKKKAGGGPAPTGAAPPPAPVVAQVTAPAPAPAPSPTPATTGLKCGDKGFCVGNVGGRMACYGNAAGCLWQGDCSSDADCTKYTAGSPYYLDTACPPVGVPYGRWGWEACAQPTPVAPNIFSDDLVGRNAAVLCTQGTDPLKNGGVYRVITGNSIAWYPSVPIAQSWDPNWQTTTQVDCTGATAAPTMQQR